MKRSIVCACACMYLSGCGLINTGPKEASPEYLEYLKVEKELRIAFYTALKDTPRAKIKVPAPGGGEYEFVTYDTPEWIPVKQEQQSEWAPVVREGISQLGFIGSVYAVGSVAESILGAAIGGTYNTGGGDLNLSNVGNKNIAAGSGTHSIHGQENPTTFLLLEGD